MTDKFVQYSFSISDLIDRLTLYVSGAAHVYVAYSDIGGDDDNDWSFLKAKNDHTLDDDTLLAATNKVDAAAAYWTIAAGKSVALFPLMVAARYCRLYLTNSTSTTLYELIFMRQVIAEQVTADNLQAISAELGDLASGSIQSPNFSGSEGIRIDLDNDLIYVGGNANPKLEFDAVGDLYINATVTFESGTTGYDNIIDKPNLPTDENLIGYWNFDEGTGDTAYDRSVNSNDGTLVGMEEANWVSGVVGNCLSFDNTYQEHVLCGDTAINGNMSISVWVKPGDTIEGIRGIVSNFYFSGNVYGTALSQNGSAIMLHVGDGAGSNVAYTWGNVLTPGSALHHLVVLHNGTEFILYVNSVKQSPEWTGPAAAQNNTDWVIGKWTSVSSDSGFYGLIDEIRVYGAILTEEEIKALYLYPAGNKAPADVTGDNTAADTSNVGGVASSTIAAWKMTGQTTIDGGNIQTDTVDTAQLNANCVTTTQIDADAVTSNEIDAVNLSGIFADLGTITAGNITIDTSGFVRGGQTNYATGTGFFQGYSGSAYKFSVGSPTKYLRFDGSDVLVGGRIIQPDNLTDYSSGNIMIAVAAQQRNISTNYRVYVKVKEIYLPRGGSLRIDFLGQTDYHEGAKGRIYRNGSAIGTEHWLEWGSWVNYSQTISGWSAGDLVQLYIQKYYTNATAMAMNFKIYADQSLTPGIIQD